MKRAIHVHPDDNVATVVQAVEPGEPVTVSGAAAVRTVQAAEAIPQGHKIALTALEPRAAIVKYGEIIGYTTAAVTAGACLHLHNMQGARGRTR